MIHNMPLPIPVPRQPNEREQQILANPEMIRGLIEEHIEKFLDKTGMPEQLRALSYDDEMEDPFHVLMDWNPIHEHGIRVTVARNCFFTVYGESEERQKNYDLAREWMDSQPETYIASDLDVTTIQDYEWSDESIRIFITQTCYAKLTDEEKHLLEDMGVIRYETPDASAHRVVSCQL